MGIWANTALHCTSSVFSHHTANPHFSFTFSPFSQQHTHLQFKKEQKIITTINCATLVSERQGVIEELEDVNQLEYVFINAYCLTLLAKDVVVKEGISAALHQIPSGMHSYEEFCIIFISAMVSKFLPILNLLHFVTKKSQIPYDFICFC